MDPSQTPYALIGGEPVVRKLVQNFYDLMRQHEPALADLHICEPDGRVSENSRERFALFLIGWLGGPQEYMARHGHPRLRMRHAHLPVDIAMRDAWIHSMQLALDATGIQGEVRQMLDERFAQVADFLRNVEEEG